MSPKKSKLETKQKSDKTEDAIIGRAYDQLKSITKAYAEKKDESVLFVGETGSGKERFAKLFMKINPREGRKRAVNCAAFSDELLRSEIFGYVRGAFTGANPQGRPGMLQYCNNGILFLDEIGDASSEFQAAILRVFEDGTYSKVGSEVEEHTNALIIAATNKPKALRVDLKYRFNILHIPPMQKEDIPSLVEHFLKNPLPLKEEYLEELMARDWPGNVRELKRECKKLLITKGDQIFCKEPQGKNIYNSLPLDNERFSQEKELWDKYIQPVLEKYNIKNFRYRYMPWDEIWMKEDSGDHLGIRLNAKGLVYGLRGPVNRQTSKEKLKDPDFKFEDSEIVEGKDTKKLIAVTYNHKHPDTDSDIPDYSTPDLRRPQDIKEKYYHGLSDIIDWLINEAVEDKYSGKIKVLTQSDKESLLYIFKVLLGEVFEIGVLPYLLEELKLKYEPTSKRKLIDKPILSPLLELPPKEASKEFMRLYLQYHIQKNPNDLSETAKQLGLKDENILKQKLDRLNKHTD